MTTHTDDNTTVNKEAQDYCGAVGEEAIGLCREMTETTHSADYDLALDPQDVAYTLWSYLTTGLLRSERMTEAQMKREIDGAMR
jgi:hypothetical protein